jgi:hypothetical protein
MLIALGVLLVALVAVVVKDWISGFRHRMTSRVVRASQEARRCKGGDSRKSSVPARVSGINQTFSARLVGPVPSHCN